MRNLLSFATLLALLAFGSCKRAEPARPVSSEAPVQTFEVQGFLRSIDFAERSVNVEHEDIPDYMPAMTMPFDVKKMEEVEKLSAGDAIGFKLVVTDKSSWIEDVKKIDPREVQIARKPSVSPSDSSKVARLKEGDPLPEFRLIDSKGREITRQTFAGRPLLITFIFTRCPIPNYCPLMTNNFREIRQALDAIPEKSKEVQLLSISFDSEYDTPEVLAQYAAKHTADTDRWRFASGTAEESRRLTQAFAVSVQPESGTINHSLATALISSDGAIRAIWRGNGWKPAEVVEAIRSQ